MVDISHLNAANAYNAIAKKAGAPGMDSRDASKETSFGDVLREGIENTIEAQKASEATSAQAVMGQADLVDVMEAVNNAETSLNLFLSVRDRVIEAYEQILRMPI